MLLLDTNALLWFWHGDAHLGPSARGAIEDAWRTGDACVSAISFWEVAMLYQKGRVELPVGPSEWRRAVIDDGLVEIPVGGAIATRGGLLPDLHGDPADRLILATALQGHQLVTADVRLLDWPGAVRRLDARE